MRIYGYWVCYLLGASIVAIGLLLAGGGGYLLVLGGSWYFFLAGLGLVVSGVSIILRKPIGAWIYGTVFIASALWALCDVGIEFWPLFSRLFALDIIAILVALAYPALGGPASQPKAKVAAYGVAAMLAFAAATAFLSAFAPKSVVGPAEIAPAPTPVNVNAVQKDWAHWGNTTMGTRFARVDQINKGNISSLALAWTAHTGDVPINDRSKAEDQNTPLQLGDSIFVCTASSRVVALDADTGAERWRFDPKGTSPEYQRCRGLGFYDRASSSAASNSGKTSDDIAGDEVCSRRLFVPTDDARLFAIDATTGKP
jgi:quinate dehydrogenase (quinone)